MFDTSGQRSHKGEHVVDIKAKERAEARRAKSSKADRSTRSKSKRDEDAVVKPVYDVEIQRFKAIVRQIAKHELEPQQSSMFQMENRSRLRRLANLGIYGHQPGIAAHVRTEPDEQERIVEAILKQKVGSCYRAMKQFREYTEHRKIDTTAKVRIRITRTATRTIIKWIRRRRTQEEEEEEEEEEDHGE